MSEVKFDEKAAENQSSYYHESSRRLFLEGCRWQFDKLQSELKEKDELLDECERLFERLIESFNYALENNLKLTPSKQFHFLFLLDDEGRMIFKFTKEKELLQKLKERGGGNDQA